MININNIILRKTSGQFGKAFVVRNYNGREVISKFPRTPDPSLQTEIQRATRSRFRRASDYAKECMLMPERKEYYREMAKRQKLPNAYTAAIKDFMRTAPQLESVSTIRRARRSEAQTRPAYRSEAQVGLVRRSEAQPGLACRSETQAGLARRSEAPARLVCRSEAQAGISNTQGPAAPIAIGDKDPGAQSASSLVPLGTTGRTIALCLCATFVKRFRAFVLKCLSRYCRGRLPRYCRGRLPRCSRGRMATTDSGTLNTVLQIGLSFRYLGIPISTESLVHSNSIIKKIQMKFRLITLFLLLTATFTSFAQEKQFHKSKKHHSAVAEKGLIKISVMYPFAEGKTFNMEYYETKHMPMVAGFLGSNLVKYTIEKGLASGIPNQPLPYMAIGTFYVKSLADYQAAIAPNRDAIRADFANYTNVAPLILVSEVVR